MSVNCVHGGVHAVQTGLPGQIRLSLGNTWLKSFSQTPGSPKEALLQEPTSTSLCVNAHLFHLLEVRAAHLVIVTRADGRVPGLAQGGTLTPAGDSGDQMPILSHSDTRQPCQTATAAGLLPDPGGCAWVRSGGSAEKEHRHCK